MLNYLPIIGRSDSVPNLLKLRVVLWRFVFRFELHDLSVYSTFRPFDNSAFSVWSLLFMLTKYALHNSSRLWCNVGRDTVVQYVGKIQHSFYYLLYGVKMLNILY